MAAAGNLRFLQHSVAFIGKYNIIFRTQNIIIMAQSVRVCALAHTLTRACLLQLAIQFQAPDCQQLAARRKCVI